MGKRHFQLELMLSVIIIIGFEKFHFVKNSHFSFSAYRDLLNWICQHSQLLIFSMVIDPEAVKCRQRPTF